MFSSFEMFKLVTVLTALFIKGIDMEIIHHSDLNIRELGFTLIYLPMGSELSGKQRTLSGNEGSNVLFRVVLFSSRPGLPNYSPISITASLLTLKA